MARVHRLRGFAAAWLLLQGCAAGAPPRNAPVLPSAPPAWQEPDGRAPLQPEWWMAFGDPVLDQLQQEAAQRNHDLRIAGERLVEVRAMYLSQRGLKSPALALAGSVERSRSISEILGRPHEANIHAAQLQASYEIDLWGGIDAATQAAAADTAAAGAAREAVGLTVAAAVADSYIRLRALDALLELSGRTLASRQRSLLLTRSRQQSGYGSGLESAQAEAEYHLTAQAIPQFELSRQQLEQGLNILLGRPPGPIERGLSLGELLLPALPDAGFPSQLLRRRPDIAAAEAQLAAADARLQAARARLLPRLQLSASIARAGSSALSEGPFTLWQLGASVLAPLFEGGRLRTQAAAGDSRREQALIGYERVVVKAFTEVETQLRASVLLQEQAVQVEAQRQALQEALRIAGNRYREGYSSYLEELLAERNLFAAEQSRLQLQTALFGTWISLCQALGGGWQAPP